MKITETNLNDSLKKSLDSIYIILSDESILIEECLEKIYDKAKTENFTEKDTHVVDPRTNWGFLTSNSENLDLFGSKKIIEIKLLGQGPGIKGANALKEYTKNPDPNTLLVVIGENLERKTFSSAWVKTLEKKGLLLSIPSLSSSSLAVWIKNKGEELDVEIIEEAGQLLAEKTEGNLMATLQEIRKLSLVYPNTLLVVIGENLERKTFSSAWVKTLEKKGLLLSIPSLSSSSLAVWIKNKGEELDVEIIEEAGQLLAEKTEGNLMATLQEIRKLSLVYPSEQIDLEKMKKNITDSSRYSIFDFSNAFVSRNTKRAVQVLETLKAEGTPETLIIWALSRELNNLFKVSKTGSTKGIWGPRNYLDSLEKTSKEINEYQILKAFKSIAFIDSCIKGFSNQNPWVGIRELTITF